MRTQKLTVLEKVGFGAGDLAVNVVISAMFLILTFFYTDVFGLKASDVALLLLLANLVDAITDPLMGLINDRFTTRWGRYRPYFLFFSVPFGLSVFLAFSTPDFDYNSKLAWAYATYVFVKLMFTAVTIPYISLIGVLTDKPQERLSANGYRLFFAKIGAFLVSIVVPLMAASWGEDNLARGYQMSMGLMALIAVAMFLFCFFTTTERVQHTTELQSLWSQLRILARNDQWLVLCAVCVAGTLGYTIRAGVGAYYAKYYLGGDEKLISTFLGTGVTAAILAMVASTWITKVYCKVKLFRYTQLLVGALSVLMFLLVGPGDTAPALVLYFLLSFVVDLHAPVFWSAIAEAIDYGQYKIGKRVAGLGFGGISFCQKAGIGIGGAVLGWLLTYFEYVPNVPQSASTLTGIALLLTIIPGVFHVLMGLFMFRYRITDEVYDEIKVKIGIASEPEAASGATSGLTANHVVE
jgi:GPH family glycoside/pentoside/hexuronide:cation symporter